MHSKLRELSKVTQQIESQWRILVVQENASKRDLWKRKVEQVVEDCDQFRVALERFKGRVSAKAPAIFSSFILPRGFWTVSESQPPSGCCLCRRITEGKLMRRIAKSSCTG
jgi:hypothetical protein